MVPSPARRDTLLEITVNVLFIYKFEYIEPIGIMYLSSFLKEDGHECHFIDLEFAKDLDAEIRRISPAVIAYSVTQRTKEIGIRMALGEGPQRIQNLVVVRGLKLIMASVVVGLVSAIALSRVLSNLLFGVSATDPLTFVALSAVLIVVALAASWVPAFRATRIDPLDALRTE